MTVCNKCDKGGRNDDVCRYCLGTGKLTTIGLTGLPLLRSVLNEEENGYLDGAMAMVDSEVNKRCGYGIKKTSSYETPSAVLMHLFSWRYAPPRENYWSSLHKKLKYLEASKGW